MIKKYLCQLLKVSVIIASSYNITGCNGDGSTPPSTYQQWTWETGNPSLTNQDGIYGTLNSALITNTPGSRYGAVSWVDNSGNLWLFGGYGYNDEILTYLNDLWKYNTSTGSWTWVGGSNSNRSPFGVGGVSAIQNVASKDNMPGSRYGAVSWVDKNGNLWLFGGIGNPVGLNQPGNPGAYLNELWEYKIADSTWTLVGTTIPNTNLKGVYGTQGVALATNTPGSRSAAISWIDNNNLWLFGGYGYDSNGTQGYLNDLWEYNIASSMWTWVSGSNLTVPDDPGRQGGIAGTYGTLGSYNVNNIPGSRINSISWIDSNNNLWLFGGYGYDSTSTLYYLNDLWEYSQGLGWRWMGGSNINGQLGTYGQLDTPSTSNIPGARSDAISWIDSNNNLWLFGGYGLGSVTAASGGGLNDLWEYSIANSTWTWVSGSNVTGASSVPGTQGVASATNVPGIRSNAISWVDNGGNLWLFGGQTILVPSGTAPILNDLWKFSLQQ
jgi:N-acetylneuraminic acid mutarotase